jgi:hypothetical protein
MNRALVQAGKEGTRAAPASPAHSALAASHAAAATVLMRQEGACACGGSCPRCRGQAPLHTTPQVGAPGDEYEREADRIAEQVVHPESSQATRPGRVASGTVQRIGTEESPTEDDGNVAPEEEQQGPALQRLAAAGGGAPATRPPHFETELASSRGGGRRLEPQFRTMMEARMGADFSQVRLHRDTRAARLCEAIRARAFTSGGHVYFAHGEYRPDTTEGTRVLAHELAHVIQQGAASIGSGEVSSVAPSVPPAPSEAVQRMASLDQTTPQNLAQAGKRPWGGSDPVGNDYFVQTDAGSVVTGWVAYSGSPENRQYWCHGFSLGTYQQWGYSVYSGTPMQTVIRDEYQPIAPASAQAGDLAVWVPGFQHSAVFTSAAVSGGALDENRSRLDSKNGQQSLANYSLAQLVAVPQYGSGYAAYRMT